MQQVHRKAALVIGGAAVLVAASSPTYAGALSKATDVIVRNTATDPVLVKFADAAPVAVAGDVAVPGGVAVTNQPTVKIDDAAPVGVRGDVAVPDGVAVTNQPTVKVAPPVRFQEGLRVSDGGESASGEKCATLDPPEGKRYVIESVHLEGRFSGTGARPGRAYARAIHTISDSNSISSGLTRIAPEWHQTDTDPVSGSTYYAADVVGPYLTDGSSREFAICAQRLGPGVFVVSGVAVGTVEDL